MIQNLSPSEGYNLVGRNLLHNHTNKYIIKSNSAKNDTRDPDNN